ncbi:MAG: LPS-assembly protein LptD [Candidatus Omnitrophica bacterium]|nr:LPS-assembly protein LptD [Candidatus Omnitrophota bacterium]
MFKKYLDQFSGSKLNPKESVKIVKACLLGVFLGIFAGSFLFIYIERVSLLFAQESKDKESPVIVNGDTVEYLTDSKDISAVGNVSVEHKEAKLTCDKLIVNTFTKEGQAQGNCRLEDRSGVIEGSEMTYDFQDKTGVILEPDFRYSPVFGKANSGHKVSDYEFINKYGYFTTCSYDRPHYRIKARKMNLFPDDKIQTKDDIFYVGKVPLFYLPQYNHSLKDPLMHVQLMPGKDKKWGAFLLSAWRYNIAEGVRGRIFYDYRQKLGVAEGFGLNYTTEGFGKGDYKFYYTQERNRFYEQGVPAEFQRYLIRWRHQWDIDERTNLISEYYKIADSERVLRGTVNSGSDEAVNYDLSSSNFLKDYFFREYEKNTQPLSYVSLHRSFDYSSLDMVVQKRTNRWYSQAEMLPQISFSLPSLEIFQSPFYFENSSSYVNYNSKSAVPALSWNDSSYNSYSVANKISLPTKVAFISATPFTSATSTIFDKNSVCGATNYLTLATGADFSTKFYRFFEYRSNFLNLDINNLRHIITPSVNYTYSNLSITEAGDPRIGAGSSTGSSSLALGLENKLQTKRKMQSVDLAILTVTSLYDIRPKATAKRGSSLSDVLFDLELRPYSWLYIEGDANYKHTGRYGEGYECFSNANYSFNFNLEEERSFGWEQRYQRKGGNSLIFNIDWRLNPKWKFKWFRRYERGHDPTLKRGLREQEYMVSRDLHCWTLDLSYNQRRGEGETIWLIFRLNAFPECEFEFNKGYHAPKPGSQSNP